MKLTAFIIGILLVSGVIVGMYSFANTLSKEDAFNVSIDSSYQDKYDKIDELEEISKDLENKTRNIHTGKDKSFFTGTWDYFTLAKDILMGAITGTTTAMSISFDFATSFISDIGFGEEGGFITSIILIILTILVVGAVIYAITKRDI